MESFVVIEDSRNWVLNDDLRFHHGKFRKKSYVVVLRSDGVIHIHHFFFDYFFGASQSWYLFFHLKIKNIAFKIIILFFSRCTLFTYFLSCLFVASMNNQPHPWLLWVIKITIHKISVPIFRTIFLWFLPPQIIITHVWTML